MVLQGHRTKRDSFGPTGSDVLPTSKGPKKDPFKAKKKTKTNFTLSVSCVTCGCSHLSSAFPFRHKFGSFKKPDCFHPFCIVLAVFVPCFCRQVLSVVTKAACFSSTASKRSSTAPRRRCSGPCASARRGRSWRGGRPREMACVLVKVRCSGSKHEENIWKHM